MSTFNFNPPYSLVGQSGKTLGTTPVTLEDYGVESARLNLKSQDIDTLSWFHRGDTAPSWQQEVSLLDASGIRVFKGNVSDVTPSWDGPILNGWNVTVSGPWWWLEQAQILQTVCAENSTWGYQSPPSDQLTVPNPIIYDQNPGGVMIRIPTNPWGTLSSSNCDVRYTLDGTMPGSGSPILSPYSTIIPVSGQTINAIGTKSGGYISSGNVYAKFIDRPVFVAPQQSLSTTMTAIMTRITSSGVPLVLGTISPTFVFQQMSWQGASGADMLRDCLDAIPDAMTSVDYSSAGTPVLNIVRRDYAPIVTLSLGSDTDLTGNINLKARNSLRPGYVTVQGLAINGLGQVTLTEDSAGNGSGVNGPLGKQYVSVAGPGNRAYNNRAASLDKASFVTYKLNSVSGMSNLLYECCPNLKALALKYSFIPYAMMTGNAGPFTAISAWEETITNVYMAWGLWKDGACVTYGQQSPCSGVPEGWYGIDPLLSDSIPEWWEEISGAMRSQFKVSVKCVAVASRGSRQGADIIEMSDYYFYQSGNTAVCYRVFEFDFYAININCDGRRTFVRPCDSYMVNPITGVAQNLFQAQSTINYDGAVQLLSGSPLPLPGNVVNITGGLVEWETMNTLVAGIEIDLGDGRATLTTGSKAHQSANSLMDKFSRAASPRALQI